MKFIFFIFLFCFLLNIFLFKNQDFFILAANKQTIEQELEEVLILLNNKKNLSSDDILLKNKIVVLKKDIFSKKEEFLNLCKQNLLLHNIDMYLKESIFEDIILETRKIINQSSFAKYSDDIMRKFNQLENLLVRINDVKKEMILVLGVFQNQSSILLEQTDFRMIQTNIINLETKIKEISQLKQDFIDLCTNIKSELKTEIFIDLHNNDQIITDLQTCIDKILVEFNQKIKIYDQVVIFTNLNNQYQDIIASISIPPSSNIPDKDNNSSDDILLKNFQEEEHFVLFFVFLIFVIFTFILFIVLHYFSKKKFRKKKI